MPPTEEPAAAPPPASVAVTVRDFEFAPSTIEVPVGATVTWTNEGPTIHMVTAGAEGVPSGQFGSDILDPGQSFAVTFSEPGEYPFFCTPHPQMTGLVRVVP
ncbi:MAG: plastocyanin/azurin family copper-binding protein [Chloroflexota bacterium]